MIKSRDLRPPTLLPINQVIAGDCVEVMRGFPANSVNLVMFSPPYWSLRDYGIEGQIGLEPTYQEYVAKMVEVGREVRRVLRGDGSWYLNLGDTYAGSWGNYGNRPELTGIEGTQRERTTEFYERKDAPDTKTWPVQRNVDIPAKCKLLIPYRVALALIDDGWIVRNDITWFKPNAMPSSVKDRLTAQTERVFHLVKSRKYYYDLDAIREPHKVESIKRDEAGYPTSPMQGRYQVPWERRDGTSDQAFCNPLGKNPGDTLTIRQENIIGHFREKGSGGHYDYSGLESPEGRHYAEGGRNPGDFWPITTKPFPEAHFAVYPEALCERPIKSSCPAQVCKRCGRPRERITKGISFSNKELQRAQLSKTRYTSEGAHNPHSLAFRRQKYRELGLEHAPPRETVGFTDCGCGAGFEGGIVLDPMCGSGTTLVVAKRLGRRFIGIDLNPDYCEMARRRLGQVESPLEVFA